MESSQHSESRGNDDRADRMRRAIERNRKKQLKKSYKDEKPSPTFSSPPPRPAWQTAEAEVLPPIPKKIEEDTPTRKSVARSAEESECITLKDKLKNGITNSIAYMRPEKRVEKKTRFRRKKVAQLSTVWVKTLWIFCGLLSLRLIFSAGGVIDFYEKKGVHQDKIDELALTKKNNIILVYEIDRIQNDVTYQKKLIRDNLGFIAKNEFLILFPRTRSRSSI